MNKTNLSFVNTLRTLKNQQCTFTVDLLGGAYVGLTVGKKKINPFNFSYTVEQMPWNNRNGSVFKGHFACIGRWGEPSLGEKLAGIPNHGDFCNLLWNEYGNQSELELRMNALSKKEGLSVERKILMDPKEPVIFVSESIFNINDLGRVFNIVQHPTFTTPFLDKDLVVDCNAQQGFNQKHYHSGMVYQKWPVGLSSNQETVNLRKHTGLVNELFTYELDCSSELGWVTIYSPTFNLLTGYVWKRKTYPWLHVWHSVYNGVPYLATEFGTAALHKDFSDLIKNGNKVMNNSTYTWIEAGGECTKNFVLFSIDLKEKIEGVSNVTLQNNELTIQTFENQKINIISSNHLYNKL